MLKKGIAGVTTDGPFACRAKEDLQRIIKDLSDESTLRMVSQGGVCFLIQGAIVQVTQEDKASDMAQIHWDGIVGNIWIPSNFLSKHPILNVLGTIATPSQPMWVTKSDVNAKLDVTTTPGASATPTYGETAKATVDPTP